MKKIIDKTISFLLSSIINIMPRSAVWQSQGSFLKKLDDYTDSFTSLHQRPKKAKEVTKTNKCIVDKKMAIVIQGPIIVDFDFTIETIRLYKKSFLNHIIIVSTWENTSEIILQSLKAEKVDIVLSPLPDLAGFLNINYQITSTVNGINRAKELGAEYVYKTRTDQRMYETDISCFLLGLIQKFPLQKKDSLLKERLIACSFGTLEYRPYGVGDMFMFGTMNDMLLYWDVSLDKRTIDTSLLKDLSVLEYAKFELSETYLCYQFLNKIAHPTNWSLADTWAVYEKYFVVINQNDIDLFWYKYNWRQEKRYQYYFDHTYELMSQKSWLLLHNNQIKSNNQTESILSNKLGERINTEKND
jgi:WavE lipopolysaccharide synthesis